MSTRVREAINRGNNLLIVGLLVFTALGVFAEILREDELLDKADDAFVVLAALAALMWYFTGKRRYQRSWLPFALLAMVSVAKVLAFRNEFDDPAAVGDEFGVVIPMVVMTVVSLITLLRTREPAALPEPGPAAEIAPQGQRRSVE